MVHVAANCTWKESCNIFIRSGSSCVTGHFSSVHDTEVCKVSTDFSVAKDTNCKELPSKYLCEKRLSFITSDDEEHLQRWIRKKYDEIQLKNALLAIRNGMPVATASKTLNVPRTTLRHKIAGRAPETIAKRGPDCLLGQSIEDKLCVCLKECAGGGFPKLSREIYKQLGEKGPYVDKVPGKTWYGNFMKRHPELSHKQSEYLNKARATVTEDKIRGWFKKTLELLGEDAVILEDPRRCWNMDESAFYTNPSGGCVLAEKGKPVYGTSANSNKENITTLITINANGEFAPPLTIYKFERIPKVYYEALPTKDWGIGKSKNEIIEEIIVMN
ncbi:hypothetical protein NQ318_008645 [Aromia moschata]|uniref:HTH CENPB-type domain-containing protein n=1 Tax=Aromia moschata TaxID=1265417 RepID=A0AAV8YW68_9CUCU|nr:hypothetical protein NQ318_008645 [Aromia moschata]